MRTRWFVPALAALVGGFLGGMVFAPQPAGAVSREIIQLQQQVSQLLQGQQDLRSDVDTNSATIKTLVQQTLSSVNQLNTQMGAVQKTVQDVQANTGARIDNMTQQTQGLSDNLQDVQARVAKLSQQVSNLQSMLQSIDAKVSQAPATATNANTADAAGSSTPNASGGAAMPPISANTLYQNALRDYTSGNYKLSRQEFTDYIKHFPTNDLASNAQFYLGEIDYAQGDFKGAISAYNEVLTNYPKSFKLAACLLKKGMAELELGLRTRGTRDLREVVRRFPGTDESHRAEGELRQIERASRSRSRARR